MFDVLGGSAAIVCCDWSAALQERAATIPVRSLERATGRRQLWSSASLPRLAVPLSEIALTSAMVVPYRAATWLESAGRILAAPRASVVDLFDDKLTQRMLFKELGLHMPRWQTFGRHAAVTVAFPAVLQTRHGSLGRSTFPVSTRDEADAMATADAHLLLSERIDGPVVNATAVVADGAIVVAWPSVQLAGLAECGADGPFAYCGNDFAAAARLPSSALNELFVVMCSTGAALRRAGYRGIFGADFIFDGAHMLILELNPRFQGSTAQLCALESAAGLPSIAQAHLAQFMRLEDGRRDDARRHPLSGSEMVMWNVTGNFPARARTAVKGVSLVGCAIPGTTIERNAVIGRVRIDAGALDESLRRLTPAASRILATARAAIGPIS